MKKNKDLVKKIKGSFTLGEFKADSFKEYLLGDSKENEEFDWNKKDDPFSLDDAPKSKESEVELKFHSLPDDLFKTYKRYGLEKLLPRKNTFSFVDDNVEIVISEQDVYNLSKKRIVRDGIYEVLCVVKEIVEKKDFVKNKDLFKLTKLMKEKNVTIDISINRGFLSSNISFLSAFMNMIKNNSDCDLENDDKFLEARFVSSNESLMRESLKSEQFSKLGFFKSYSLDTCEDIMLEIHSEREKEKILNEIKDMEKETTKKRKRI